MPGVRGQCPGVRPGVMMWKGQQPCLGETIAHYIRDIGLIRFARPLPAWPLETGGQPEGEDLCGPVGGCVNRVVYI